MKARLDLWQRALRDGNVWQRSLRLGLPVGLLQVGINHGDTLLQGVWSWRIACKVVASPSLSIAIALASAAATFVANPKKDYEKNPR
jgi:hypothetical protein